MIAETIIAVGIISTIWLTAKGKMPLTIMITEATAIMITGAAFLAAFGPFGPFIDFEILSDGNYSLVFGQISGMELVYLGISVFLELLLLKYWERLRALPLPAHSYIIPWAVTGIYRSLHELLFQFNYWTTLDVLRGGFSDTITQINGQTTNILPVTGNLYDPAVMTHFHAVSLCAYTFLAIIAILESHRKNKLEAVETLR